MPSAQYADTRTDGRTHIGRSVKEIVRLMVEDGMTWQRAADVVGGKRTRAYKALQKSHVIAYRRQKKARRGRTLVGWHLALPAQGHDFI